MKKNSFFSLSRTQSRSSAALRNFLNKETLFDFLVPAAPPLLIGALAPIDVALEIGGDEGYEFVKADLLFLGFRLYSDVWNDQPPLYSLVMALCFLCFAPSALLGRCLTLVFCYLLLLSLYWTLKTSFGRGAGVIAVVFLAVSKFFAHLSASAMLEVPAMAMAMASHLPFVFYQRHAGPRVWLFVAGSLLGAALQVKLTAALFLPSLLFRCWSPVGSPGLERFKDLITFCGGLALSWGIIALVIYQESTLYIFGISHLSVNAERISGGISVRDIYINNAYFWPSLALFFLFWKSVDGRTFCVPVLLFLAMLCGHIFYAPVWYYYSLHSSIALSWLGAAGIWRSISQLRVDSLIPRWKYFVAIFLTALTVALLVKDGIENLRGEYVFFERCQKAADDPLYQFLLGSKSDCWVFTYERSTVFRARRRIPPELAVIPRKRIFSGQLNSVFIEQVLERYKPELIILAALDIQRLGIEEYVSKRYTLARIIGRQSVYCLKKENS